MRRWAGPILALLAAPASCGDAPRRARGAHDAHEPSCTAAEHHDEWPLQASDTRCGAARTTTGADPGAAPPSVSNDASSSASASPSAASSSSGVADADAVIAQNSWRFRACFGKTLEADVNDVGTVRITISVGIDGIVTRASIASASTSASLAECVRDAFAAMMFPPPPSGKPGILTVPVVFKVKTPAAKTSGSP